MSDPTQPAPITVPTNPYQPMVEAGFRVLMTNLATILATLSFTGAAAFLTKLGGLAHAIVTVGFILFGAATAIYGLWRTHTFAKAALPSQPVTTKKGWLPGLVK